MPYDWRADTRKQILKTARLKNAADSDDFYRWIYALVWFHPGGDHLPWTITDSARSLGRKGFVEADAVKMIEEAREAPKKMRADPLADWLGVTFAERQSLGLTRIGSTKVRRRARYELRKRRKKMKERERRQKKAPDLMSNPSRTDAHGRQRGSDVLSGMLGAKSTGKREVLNWTGQIRGQLPYLFLSMKQSSPFQEGLTFLHRSASYLLPLLAVLVCVHRWR